jgi:hypothetical protein
MLQPMFQVRLVKKGSRLVPQVLATVPPEKTAPPEKPISG